MEFINTILQSLPIDGSQVLNSAGGYVWKIDDVKRLHRFIVLGSEGGTYYATEKSLTEDNIKNIRNMIENSKGDIVVKELETYSVEGRTAKQDNILYALAYCARQTKDKSTKLAAYKAMHKICRIPTHLFTFVENCQNLSKIDLKPTTGWGRAHRKSIAAWYTKYASDPVKLALHVTKYKSRNGWSHFDLFRLCHVKTDQPELSAIFCYVVKGLVAARQKYFSDDMTPSMDKIFSFLQAVEDIKELDDDADEKVVHLIKQHRLVREHIPTKFLKSKAVWKMLLKDMPMTALMRNLGKMTSIGLLTEDSDDESLVVSKLTDEDKIKEAKIHPFNVLVTLITYGNGKGTLGSLVWKPCPKIVNALDKMYYTSFKFVEPTNKRFFLGVDVSGSMGCGEICGTPGITPRMGAAAMMMTTLRTEPHCEVGAFDRELMPIDISNECTLKEAIKSFDDFNFGPTDCAAPMVYAMSKRKEFDVFVIYTDNDTWCGNIHPAEALRQYRRTMGIYDARLIVIAFTATSFTIADPDDPGMLDMVGFDSGAPESMRQFVLGNI